MFTLHNKDIDNLEEDESYIPSNEDAGQSIEKTVSELASMIFQCYIEGPDEYLSRSSSANRVAPKLDVTQYTSCSNDVVKILLQCTSPLLWSNNIAVVLAAAGVHWIMASKEHVKRIVKPLLFVLRSSSVSRYVVIVYKWDQQDERLVKVSEEEEERYGEAVKNLEFDRQLGPYNLSRYEDWKRLSNFITTSVIERLDKEI